MPHSVALNQILQPVIKQKLAQALISSYRDLGEILATKSELAR